MKVTASTIARTIALFLALANQIMVSFGWSPLEIAEDNIYQICSLVATIVTAIVAWWKNNSFTKAALVGDEAMKEAKK